jgi:hypothetical protein
MHHNSRELRCPQQIEHRRAFIENSCSRLLGDCFNQLHCLQVMENESAAVQHARDKQVDRWKGGAANRQGGAACLSAGLPTEQGGIASSQRGVPGAYGPPCVMRPTCSMKNAANASNPQAINSRPLQYSAMQLHIGSMLFAPASPTGTLQTFLSLPSDMLLSTEIAQWPQRQVQVLQVLSCMPASCLCMVCLIVPCFNILPRSPVAQNRQHRQRDRSTQGRAKLC